MEDKDRELTELAALAAGIDLEPGTTRMKGTMQTWRPLDDDGAALRLAVACGIDVRLFGLFPYDGKRHVSTLVDRLGRGFNEYPGDDDACAATRRAIVRAAAELPPNAALTERGDEQ